MSEVFYDTSKLHPYDLNGVLVVENVLYGIIDNYPARRKAVPYQAIELYNKNNRTLRVYVKTADLNVVNTAGSVGLLTVKESKDSSAPVFTKSTNNPAEGAIGSPDQGELLFYIVPADTVNLDIRQYVFDVRVTLSSGKVYTVLEGVINLQQSLS